jgi:hypothetical protein
MNPKPSHPQSPARNDRSCGYKGRMTAEDLVRLRKYVRDGLEQKAMRERMGRAASTIHDWLKRSNLYQAWLAARHRLVYKVVRVGPRATYLEREQDMEIGPVKLEWRGNYTLSKGVRQLAYAVSDYSTGKSTPIPVSERKPLRAFTPEERRKMGGR